MNEEQTKHDMISPALKASGWGEVSESWIRLEYVISPGKIGDNSTPNKILKADYILIYKNVKLAVVEAKSDELDVLEGVPQAKLYAEKLDLPFAFASNGKSIYAINCRTGHEEMIEQFPTPEELWESVMGDADKWREIFDTTPFYTNGSRTPRYYQEIAVNRALRAIANGKQRILLTLATGTGKTFIACQIAYKLFESRWNVLKTNQRPRILFLSDRNILSNQAFNDFSGAFADDAMTRITQNSIRKDGKVPMNAALFFTIFQTFVGEKDGVTHFGQYPHDFFDLIIIDECHRGGANDESQWRKIMEYFDTAVQIGLTATPRRAENINTYKYFGDPVYEYSLKAGINDGFLTPFRYCRMLSNIDDYIYSPEDEIISGSVEAGKVYKEKDFYSGNITIRARDIERVKEVLKHIRENEKTIIFCATQNHAAHITAFINQLKKNKHINYCVRVTANDENIGENFLKEFQDNEKFIPCILTTSQKLSTGVDARNVRNIVLLRPVNSIIEFKQIIGRGTRTFDGKTYFTVYDFAKAYERFNDPSWDGSPLCEKCGNDPCSCKTDGGTTSPQPKTCKFCGKNPCECPKGICRICGKNPCECPKIRLSQGNTRNIKHLKTDMFYGADGKPISAETFLQELFGKLPEFFSSETDLKERWSNPKTRKELLRKMDYAGYSKEILESIQSIIDAKDSDLLDVLEYIAFNTTPIERAQRAQKALEKIKTIFSKDESDFLQFVLEQYTHDGVFELSEEKLPQLIQIYYGSPHEGINKLGSLPHIKTTFANFQKYLYVS